MSLGPFFSFLFLLCSHSLTSLLLFRGKLFLCWWPTSVVDHDAFCQQPTAVRFQTHYTFSKCSAFSCFPLSIVVGVLPFQAKEVKKSGKRCFHMESRNAYAWDDLRSFGLTSLIFRMSWRKNVEFDSSKQTRVSFFTFLAL